MKRFYSNLLRSNLTSVVAPLILIVFVLSITTEGFFSAFNLFSIGKNGSVTVLIGLAQLCVIAVGHMNLALGSMGACAAIATAAMMQQFGLSILASILIGLLTGTILGAIQGILVTRTKISPFVITLSLNFIYLGLATGITGKTIYNQIPKEFRSVNNADLFGFPVLLLISIAAMILLALLYRKTVLERKILATGANPRSAECAGVNVKGIILLSHSMSGMVAAAAGILTVMLQGSAQTSIGVNWMMLSFAGPVLGGCLLSGGRVSTLGAFFGALLMATINNSLTMINVSYFWFQAFLGAVLLLAFEMDRMRSSMFVMLGK